MSMRKMYREIAKKYGVTVTEVKRNMQAVIDETYKNPNAAALAVTRKGEKPTPEEFIAHVARRVHIQSDTASDSKYV